MRWPFTTYATGTLLVCALPLIALSVLLGRLPGLWWLVPLPLLAFFLNFFRDPEREPLGDELDLLSPADGVVADVLEVDDPDLGCRATRIGIFLSVFNVHVNRVPCAGSISAVSQREGGYLDARHPNATDENRAATIVLQRGDGRSLAIRQITGLIARRIICPVEPGNVFVRGQRYGMIRFGSRTELVVPLGQLEAVRVKVGDKVQGGSSLLGRLRPPGAAPS